MAFPSPRLRPIVAAVLGTVGVLATACADAQPSPPRPSTHSQQVASVSVPGTPSSVVVAPDGRRVYVTSISSAGAGHMSVIDTETNRVVGSVQVGRRLQDLAITPQGDDIYLADGETDTVFVLDPDTGEITAKVATKSPYAVAAHPKGGQAYVLNRTERARITPISRKPLYALPKAEPPFSVGGEPVDIAFSPGGDRLYVLVEGSVIEMDTKNHKSRATYPVGAFPRNLVVHPWKALAYVVDEYSYTVSLLDTKERRTVGALPLASTPRVAAISPDGRRLYIGVQDSKKSVHQVLTLDTNTNTVVGKPITVSGAPVALAVSPRGNRLYVPMESGRVAILAVPAP